MLRLRKGRHGCSQAQADGPEPPPGRSSRRFRSIAAGPDPGASSQRRFWTLRSLWIYGLEGWSWRVASATALITVMIVVAASYVYFGGKLERLTAPQVAMGTLNTAPLEKDAGQPSSENRLISDADLSSSLGKIPPFDAGRGNWAKPLAEPADSEYVDVFVPIAGDQKLVLRLPKTIRMRNEQPSGEYFIRSISY